MRFVGRVGGVAFDALAVPADDLNVKLVSLKIDPSLPDGNRLIVSINGKPAKTDIFDWQLVPTVKYADSDSTSCFTLFGDLEDEEEQLRLRRQGARILNYDKAFQDTLMGLRLFQLDILILGDDFSIDLPKDEGKYLLGAGEKAPDLAAALDYRNQYNISRRKLDEKGEKEGFSTDLQSYVITDHEVKIEFGVEEGRLRLTGDPFYYFWKDDEDDLEGRWQQAQVAEAIKAGILEKDGTFADLRALILEEAQKHEKSEEEARVKAAQQMKLISATGTADDLEAFEEKAEARYEQSLNSAMFEIAKSQGKTRPEETATSFARRIFDEYLDADDKVESAILERNEQWREAAKAKIPEQTKRYQDYLDQMVKLESKAEELNADNEAKHQALEAQFTALRRKADDSVAAYQDSEQATAHYLKEFSALHVPAAEILAKMNPAVWNAARQTMRYGAFFRYCKMKHPKAWGRFLQEVNAQQGKLNLKPEIKTPTVLQQRASE